jgi:hypothetical protein
MKTHIDIHRTHVIRHFSDAGNGWRQMMALPLRLEDFQEIDELGEFLHEFGIKAKLTYTKKDA